MVDARAVNVTLTANTAPYVAGMNSATAATQRTAATAATASAGIQRTGQSMATTAGQAGLLRSGLTTPIAAVGAAVVGTTKAAIDWESAWAGVNKTVDGTDQQMSALQGDLRDMAKELPATHGEIAGVAEAAGQLGVATEDVADFSRVMIDLGETTNLSADQAATSLARFSNIMGTSQDDVERLGSTIVDLGNNSETTEAEILTLGQRLAAAGKIAGLSESDVLAFAATLTSVGVEAEAGGTALSKVFTSVRDAVLDGSEALDTFAQVAGVTAEDFAAQFEADPAAAIAGFIEGLGRMNAAGQSTTQVFKDLSLTDQRLMRALLSTAEAGDMLTDSLEMGNEAWEQNTALAEEAELRYETTAAQLSMSMNKIKDAAITMGATTAPVLADVASLAADTVGLLVEADQKLQDLQSRAPGGGGDGPGFLDLARGMVDPVQQAKNVRGGFDELFGGDEEISRRAGMSDVMSRMAEATRDVSGAQDEAAGSSDRLGGALDEVEQEAEETSERIDALADSLFASAAGAINLEEREYALVQALERAREASEDDELSKQDQRGALRGVATASHDVVLGLFEQGAETDKIIGKTQRAREDFIEVAESMGYSSEKAEKLADKYGLIPGEVMTVVTLRDLATEDIGNIRDRLNEIDGRSARVEIINEVITNNRVNTYFETFGNQGRGGQTGHSGGMVTTAGIIPRMHDGGTVTAMPRLHAGSSTLASDEVPAILQTGEMVLSRAQVAMMERARYLELIARDMVRLGDVTDEEWEQLLALGWQGKAGDRMEALYPPLEGVRREFIKLGEVTNSEWDRLMRLGWQGKAGDRMEALYPPLESLAVEASRAAKLLRDANLNQISPVTGNKRVYDFFRSGGKSFAHIFGTGETLALGQMGEMQAGRFLRAMGKIPKAHDGASVVGTNEGLAVLQRGEEVMSAQVVGRLERAMAPVARPMGGGGSVGMASEAAQIVIQHMELKAVGEPFNAGQVAAKLEAHMARSGAA